MLTTPNDGTAQNCQQKLVSVHINVAEKSFDILSGAFASIAPVADAAVSVLFLTDYSIASFDEEAAPGAPGNKVGIVTVPPASITIKWFYLHFFSWRLASPSNIVIFAKEELHFITSAFFRCHLPLYLSA